MKASPKTTKPLKRLQLIYWLSAPARVTRTPLSGGASTNSGGNVAKKKSEEIKESKEEEVSEEKNEEVVEAKEEAKEEKQKREDKKGEKEEQKQGEQNEENVEEDEITKEMKETGVSKEQEKKFLVPLSFYLSTGIHIGMKQRVKDMEEYIYKVRNDKLAVFDVPKIDYKLKMAANLLAQYEPKDILVVSRKRNGHKPVVKFAEVVGANAVYGRFMPGTLTNPKYEKYMEPKVIVLTDPFADKQAFEEAVKSNMTIIAMCDTFNQTKNIDLVIPMNNKGRKSVALAYMLLAREYLKKRGEIKGDAEFKYTLKDFEMPATSN